jgi:hypothetical protein
MASKIRAASLLAAMLLLPEVADAEFRRVTLRVLGMD